MCKDANKLNSKDRISQLPDALLSHILSHLPTKESVKTSILSKRWVSVWSHVPVLHLDDSSLHHPKVDKDQAIHTSFIKFLDNVFNLNKADSIHKFTLKCTKFDSFRVNEWILAALKRKVSEIDLCIAMNQRFNLAFAFFIYQDLVALKLGKNFVLNVPERVLFPCLKKLHLDSIDFSDNVSLPKLLSGCPVLEDLHIETCGMLDFGTLEVKSNGLRFLTLEDWSDYSPKNCEYQIVVDAPNLEVLTIETHMAKGYCFKNLNSLVEAHIDVYVRPENHVQAIDVARSAHGLVSGLVNAKTLTFNSNSLGFLSFLKVGALPKFRNLTKLELEGNKYYDKLLPQFLHNSPILEVLVLELLVQENVDNGTLGGFKWNSPTIVPECMKECLKSVKIWGFQGQENVLEFIRYLVLNAKALNEISAAKCESEHEEIKVSKQLLSYIDQQVHKHRELKLAPRVTN